MTHRKEKKVFISTNCLCKQYHGKVALEDVSIHIPEGAIYGLIGPNGSGKTTLMRLLTKLQVPSSGEIITDKYISTSAIIESPALYLMKSAKSNLKYQQYISKKSNTDIKQILELVQLPDTKKPVINYSLGMKQRLGIAMALISNPSFLLLDEPLNGLDPEGIKSLRSLIHTLNQEYHITILISSHFLGELEKTATHYGFLSSGRLIKEFSSTDISGCNLETLYFNTIGGNTNE